MNLVLPLPLAKESPYNVPQVHLQKCADLLRPVDIHKKTCDAYPPFFIIQYINMFQHLNKYGLLIKRLIKTRKNNDYRKYVITCLFVIVGFILAAAYEKQSYSTMSMPNENGKEKTSHSIAKRKTSIKSQGNYSLSQVFMNK